MEKRKAMLWIRRTAGIVVTVALLGLLVYAALPKPLEVESALVRRGALVVTVNEDGRARVKDRYTVSAPLSGNLARIRMDPGDRVAEGEPIARIMPLEPSLLDPRSRAEAEARVAQSLANQRLARAQIGRAQAALEYAEREETRQESLADAGGTSAQARDRARFERRAADEELESARFAARVAAFEVQMARAVLGRLRGSDEASEHLAVPAPVSGEILRILVESEGVVRAGTPLIEVGDPEALEIVVDVLTTDAVDVAPGAPVTIEHWGGDDDLRGRVRLKEPSAFTRTSALGVEEQRVNVIIDVVEPYEQWSALGDGYRVEARIEVYRNDEATKVPASALFRHADGWAVYVVEDGVAHLREVSAGHFSDTEAEIVEGLEEGLRVVVHPSDALEDGMEVSIE